MTAEERGGNEDDLDVFRPQRPLPRSAEDALRLFEEGLPARLALEAAPHPAAGATPDDPSKGVMRLAAPNRPVGLLVGTAIVAACGLLLVAVIRESTNSPEDGTAVAGVLSDQGDGLPVLPAGPSDTPSPSPSSAQSPSTAHLEPGLETAASRITATKGPAHSAAGSTKGGKGGKSGSAKPSTAATGSAGHGSTTTPKPHPTATVTKWSLRSVNYQDRYWTYRDGLGYLDQVNSSSSAKARESATFTVVAGLADSGCYSFKVSGGGYLRHQNFRIHVEAYDGSSLFRKDATFCPHPDSRSGTVSFESYNYPGRYLRHRNFQLWIDPYQNTSLFRSDSSFTISSPLS